MLLLLLHYLAAVAVILAAYPAVPVGAGNDADSASSSQLDDGDGDGEWMIEKDWASNFFFFFFFFFFYERAHIIELINRKETGENRSDLSGSAKQLASVCLSSMKRLLKWEWEMKVGREEGKRLRATRKKRQKIKRQVSQLVSQLAMAVVVLALNLILASNWALSRTVCHFLLVFSSINFIFSLPLTHSGLLLFSFIHSVKRRAYTHIQQRKMR